MHTLDPTLLAAFAEHQVELRGHLAHVLVDLALLQQRAALLQKARPRRLSQLCLLLWPECVKNACTCVPRHWLQN